MNTPRFLYSILALILISIVGCEEDDNISKKENNPENMIIPIEKGNKWVYKSMRINNDKEEYDTIEMEIGEEIIINDVKAFKMITELRPYNACFLVKADSEGNYIVVGGYSDIDTLLSPSIHYKYDVNSGDSWIVDNVILHYSDGLFEKRSKEIRCLNSDTIVNTDKGQFLCRLYEDSPNNGDDIFRKFIVENIGIIVMEHWEDGKLFSYRELIDYELVK